MGAVMRRRGARAFSRGRRLTAGSPTHRGGAGGAEMPVRPEPHLSGQPGGCLGVAASIKYSHQVLFFLPITALTILAIATAMPSDSRLCSRQK